MFGYCRALKVVTKYSICCFKKVCRHTRGATWETGLRFLKNLKVSLAAAGPATVISVEVICITLLGLFGDGPMTGRAMACLAVATAATFLALVTN
jgi:hypothetical protein